VADEKLSARLEAIRTRSRWTSSADGIAAPGATAIGSARDVPRLLAAVDKVLELAADWQRKAEINRRLLAKWNNPHYTVPLEAETKQLEQCAEGLRSAVLATLTGEAGNGN
jgi:hypothetical protein